MRSLNTAILSIFPSKFPAQNKIIANLLGSLDDKIELNRHMNKTLEAMAHAIFKSWFVDFDPVRAKMEGRQPIGMDADTATLFPDSMDGDVPKGWRMGILDDVLSTLISGARPHGGSVNSGIPSVGAENIINIGVYNFSKEKYIPCDFYIALKARGADIRCGDVLLYKDGAQVGRKTYFDFGFPHEDCAINEHVFILRTKDINFRKFLYFWLDQSWVTKEIINLNSNSAQPGINQPAVRSLEILIPDRKISTLFDKSIEPLIHKIFLNCQENNILSKMRDVLLPKLMSGEILIRDKG